MLLFLAVRLIIRVIESYSIVLLFHFRLLTSWFLFYVKTKAESLKWICRVLLHHFLVVLVGEVENRLHDFELVEDLVVSRHVGGQNAPEDGNIHWAVKRKRNVFNMDDENEDLSWSLTWSSLLGSACTAQTSSSSGCCTRAEKRKTWFNILNKRVWWCLIICRVKCSMSIFSLTLMRFICLMIYVSNQKQLYFHLCVCTPTAPQTEGPDDLLHLPLIRI